MSRRIDVELTSRRDDGSWTWRAAGAKAPKGVVESSLLPVDVQVGHVLRVEIETFLDGIAILAVLPPKGGRSEPQRLELLGPRNPERLVTTTLAPRGRGDRERPRRPRDGEGGERREGGRREGRGGREGREGGPRERRASEAGERRPRPDAERRPPVDQKPKPKRLRPGRTHRRDLIAGLPEEQRPIAEELSRGGIPGVRAALDAQNAQATAEGRPEINPAPLLALAEELWPRMRSAEWLDRAEAAVKEVDELDLRDLRSVVVAADSAARDDDSRALAAQLREALTRRVDEEHLKWLTELAELVADNRVVAALRRSSRPPKAGAPLPSDLARLIIDRTSEALNAEVGADRWSVLLDALSFSPVRSSVTPAAVPESPNEELMAAVRKSAARLPHIAALFGIEAPPVPAAPVRGGRRGASRSGGRPDRGGGAAPIPPPPPRPTEAEAAATGNAGGGSAESPPAPELAGETTSEQTAETSEAVSPDELTETSETATPEEPAATGEAAADTSEAATPDEPTATSEPAPTGELATEPAPTSEAPTTNAPVAGAHSGNGAPAVETPQATGEPAPDAEPATYGKPSAEPEEGDFAADESTPDNEPVSESERSERH